MATSRFPLLSGYPRLHAALKADPAANSEFNALVSGLSKGPNQVGDSSAVRDELERLRAAYSELLKKDAQQAKDIEKLHRFIKLLGEAIEGQLSMRPYSQDLAESREYNIKFSPAQIRMAMHAFWDIIGEDMEKQIRNANDPAEAREEEGI